MQEPEIFEQPVASKDTEAAIGVVAEDNHTGYTSGYHTNHGGEDSSLEDYHDFVYPEDRKLGTWSTTFLIINRVVGAGIFSTPSEIIRLTGNVGATLLFWVLGGFMTLFVYLEYGTALPRSGGEKVYLERVYRRPRYLATCIFAVQFVLFAISTAGSVSFASYMVVAAHPNLTPDPWTTRGVAMAAITGVCLIHALTPRLGIWLGNILGAFKLVLLSLVVFTGFAALAGHTINGSPGNFSSFAGPPMNTAPGQGAVQAAGYALAILQVLYAYAGWENANYVLTEVRNAPTTLKRAAPIAVSIVTVLYVLANIAYVMGQTAFVTRALPVFISLSALGNVFAQSFAMPRVKQELAKEGILPFSRFWASDWPVNAPSGAILLHWLITMALILGSQISTVYTFVTNVFIFTGNWIKIFLALGLLYLNFTPSENWAAQRTTFRSSPILTIFWILSLLFVVAAPFIPNNLISAIPYYVVPVLGTGMLGIGVIYWLVWAKLLPLMGFDIQHEIVQMPDGSERVKYKLRQFPYEDIEFFLPQLCHLIISVDNESMALEEFLLDLCEESVTAALLTFWLFQTYLHDLSSNPQADAFKTCRRVYNKVQHIVFGLSDSARNEKITENILPVTVLGSFVLASIACPALAHWAGPLAVAQARKPRPVETISEAAPTPTPVKNLAPTRSHTVGSATTKSRRLKDGRVTSAPDTKPQTGGPQLKPARPAVKSPRTPRSPGPRPMSSGSSSKAPVPTVEVKRPSPLEGIALDARLSSASLPLPDSRSPNAVTRPTTPISAGIRPSDGLSRRHSHNVKTLLTQSEMTHTQKMRLLRQNYFRCETAFLTALEDISNRLVIVPKAARLSALRAELALIAQDLPAEVDIPVICPPNLVDGSPARSRHHRIVRLNPAEATVLNSAEKVPYLLMVEVLRDDFTFDPESQDNQRLLTTLLAEQGTRKRIFDLSEAPRIQSARNSEPAVDSVFEPTSGDLGSSPMLKTFGDDAPPSKNVQPGHPPRVSSANTVASAVSVSDLTTPRSSGTSTSRSSSPPLRKVTLTNPRNTSVDQPDFSALATHMRTASQMLAQLDATSGKRPKAEVAAIRTRIIASMQSLEEQSFELDDGQGPTFDMIIAKATAAPTTNGTDVDDDPTMDTGVNTSAGIARMENDFKTGGLQRKGDRDDPSAAVFGEAWEVKKERIRKSSPYGWMKNWDLVSVIVKTGADLRQEAFACQLIRVCHKIWVDAGVPVWVKLMRILVTGESSGLIETIANGVSLHSIKRSLTLASIESGQNPRRRIATLKDHFAKAFGAAEGEAYRAGVDAFKRSLAAYSVISYVLQLKDRHNGNVLIDNEGHIIHIDFGFMLSNSPGSVGFEAAPFKLTQEYVDVLGGVTSTDFEDFKKLCKQAFQALRRSADNIIDLVSMMGRESKMPCYGAGVGQVTTALRQRFQLHLSADEAESFVETDLIGKYDTFQYRTQGIY
ncbi:phosphatidylinositol 4-kinase-like protein [Echria macrotheca]|uniref:1-phosphatidylinositol 4-kinase n=1 Tax=Echria macrotheca TaxID=438768 RepID=A0AAJ0F703_9PEZI|nr:phosphatidylinositol 4-kinase-like protein [Echria macrotheca]